MTRKSLKVNIILYFVPDTGRKQRQAWYSITPAGSIDNIQDHQIQPSRMAQLYLDAR